MFMKIKSFISITYLLTATFFITMPKTVCSQDETAAAYAKQGQNAALLMQYEYETMHKPKYQQAYEDYLNDLKLISQFGKAQDNENLFNDLRQMNSEEEVIYSHTDGSIRVGFGHLM